MRVNADSVEDLKNALSFGASGVGLCRSEHMMLKPEILKLFQKYILSEKDEYLLQLIELLTCEVESMLCLLHEKTFLIRLLDPPLHEFLPSDPVVIARLQSELNFTDSQLKARLDLLSEHNPMLGFRGCRLGILKPIIYKLMMQAILQAASNVNLHGVVPKVQIQVPFVCDPKELKLLKGLYDDLDFSSTKSKIEFGAMLETPRSCLLADEIAEYADFLSFGTNDLTQMTFGISRDDSTVFLSEYHKKSLISDNPFSVLDQRGVVELMKIAIKKARTVKPELSIGICGEQASCIQTQKFCLNDLKLDYVSISGFNVLQANLNILQC